MQILNVLQRDGVFAWVVAATAAVLGCLLLLGGLGLLFAVLTTRQGVQTLVTAAAQILVGGINLWMIRSVFRHELRALALSATGTIVFSVFLSLSSSSSDLIAILQLYLLVLLAFIYRERAAFLHVTA